jgi:hypothetical protein
MGFRSSSESDRMQVRVLANRFGMLALQMINEENVDPMAVMNALASQLASGLHNGMAQGALKPESVELILDAIRETAHTGKPAQR